MRGCVGPTRDFCLWLASAARTSIEYLGMLSTMISPLHTERQRCWLSIFAGLFLFAYPMTGRGEGMLVFAAASLADAMEEVGALFREQHDVRLEFCFDASSTLARQIVAGAPADVFISADEAKMDMLQARGLLVDESRRRLWSNQLVIVVPRESGIAIDQPEDLAAPDVTRIAVADPWAVPAGMYAKSYLEKAGVWMRIRERVLPQQHVRAVLAVIEAGNADVGFVYRTDALMSTGVRVEYAIRPELTRDIVYPAAVLADAKNRLLAMRFLDLVQSPAVRALMARRGFIPGEP